MSLKDPNVVSKSHPKRVAIVIANPAISTTTQWPVGFWWSELSHPYYVLTEAGYEIEAARLLLDTNGPAAMLDRISLKRRATSSVLGEAQTSVFS